VYKRQGVNTKPIKLGFWLAIGLLIGGLVVANIVYFEAYDPKNTIKAIAIIVVGWLAYAAIFKRTALKLPRIFEQFEDLIGVMTLVTILLFWATFV
jgi:multicomponent Na+:H+ antiporter subunit D